MTDTLGPDAWTAPDYRRAFRVLEQCATSRCLIDLKEQTVEALSRELQIDHVSFFAGATFHTTFQDRHPVVAGLTSKMLPEYQGRWCDYDMFSSPPALRMLVTTGVASLHELPRTLPPPARAYAQEFIARVWRMEAAAAVRLELPSGHTALIGLFSRSSHLLGPKEVATLRLVSQQLSAISRGLPEMRSDPAIRDLPERQREVSELVAQGLSNAEIAEALSLAEDSVKKYVGRILKSTGCQSRVELALLVRSAR